MKDWAYWQNAVFREKIKKKPARVQSTFSKIDQNRHRSVKGFIGKITISVNSVSFGQIRLHYGQLTSSGMSLSNHQTNCPCMIYCFQVICTGIILSAYDQLISSWMHWNLQTNCLRWFQEECTGIFKHWFQVECTGILKQIICVWSTDFKLNVMEFSNMCYEL